MRKFKATCLLLVSFLLIACGDTTTASDSDSVNDTATTRLKPQSIFDTTYRYERYNLVMEIRRRDTLISKTVMQETTDTVFHPDGKVDFVHTYPFNESDEEYRDYYINGAEKRIHRCFDRDGMGGTTGECKYYDSLGNLDSMISNKDYLPNGATSHLDICGVVTYEYFENGKLQLVKKYDEHYEGCYRCPCGTWEYYDENGKLTKKESYQKCGEGNTECEDICN